MKKIYITILVLTIFSFSSCENILDSRLSVSVPESQAIVDLESLNQNVLGMYPKLASSNTYNRTIMLLPAIMSDNAYIDGKDNTGRFLDYDSYGALADNGYAGSLWRELAKIVAQSSIVIRNGEQLSLPALQQDDKNHYIGEAYALRALAYFNYQQFYAQPYNFTSDASHLGAPLPDFNVVGGKELVFPKRNTTAEVYAQIKSDLTKAISLMQKKSYKYRMDLDAAKALFARVSLVTEDWVNADKYASQVIASNFTLLTAGGYIGSWGADSNSETIFSVLNDEIQNSGTASVSYFYLGYKDAFASEDFVNTFTNTDVRKFLYPLDGAVRLISKFPDRESNVQVFRLSEMHLIKAEALAHIPGREADAQAALFVIMQRADASVTSPTETGQALIDRILLERRKELAFEGLRLFDLTRNKKSFTKYRHIASDISVTYPNNKAILPIPSDEINGNPNMAGQQNPGY